MSRPQSLLDQLDAISAIADRAGAPAPEPAPERPREPPRAETSASKSAGPMSNEAIYGLLMELKRDITSLQREQPRQLLPDNDESLYGLLAELKRDIDVLRREQSTPRSAHEGSLYGILAELKRDIAALQREQAAPAMPAQERQLYGMLAELRRDVEALRQEQSAHVLPPGERQLYAMLAELRAEIKTLQDGGVTASAPRSAGQFSNARPGVRGANRQMAIAAGIAALCAVPLALAAGIYFMGRNPGMTAHQGRTPAAAIETASVSSPLGIAGGESALFEALAVGGTSPRGISASGVANIKALTRASQLLAVEGARDTDEAGFWLKRYMTSAFSDRNVARALTQLGSSYADGGGKAADYVKARYLWEISGSAGDPVAMCFLGRLFEDGLGVQTSKRVALQWYERAKTAGGCPDNDEAIGRVK